MYLYLLAVLVVVAESQYTLDPGVLDKIFNNNLGYPKVITVKLKEGVTSYVDTEGRQYVCIPQYPSDPNISADEMSNSSVTGCGVLQVRSSGENDDPCTPILDSLCTMLIESMTPKPPPTKIRGCGYRNPKELGIPSKTSGTQFGEFPWVIALLNSTDQRYVGVGALISPEVVITTAHVVCRFCPNSLKIRAGEWDMSKSTEIYGHQDRNVKEIYILNEFNRTNPRHNIALIRLEQPLDLTEHVNVVCLPEQDEVFDRCKNCIANGWDKTAPGPKTQHSSILKKVQIDIIPYTRCSTLLKRTRLGSNFRLHSSFICGGGAESKNTCQGDGGAPLVCPIGNDRYKLTGLVSWGIGCGQKATPALYTNVPKYRQWVDKKMENWGLETLWYKIDDS
ncbi:unnamed protein product [Arctia plantaginis]|uniref:Peptidase S1 domain-containing protein n=1 Tax=Arctia plantaginis TaxID=874455 RepID=A0A8S1BTJ4_ARCPL|nr:unnamed protein product [Arctia plantaginis]